MKKLLLLTLAILLSLTAIGRPRGLNPREIDNAITDWVLESLREMGYTVLPEVIVQDTLNRNGQKSNYQKYWEEKHGSLDKPKHDPRPEFDDLYYQPSKDGQKMKHKVKKDTLETKQVTVNNYYYDDNFYYRDRLRPFFYPSFYFSWNFYTPYYYRWYDPFYYDWYFPYSWYTPYYSWNYWWGWGYPNHYIHYDYHYGYNNHYSYNTIQYSRRDRPSTMTQNNSVNRRIPQEPERRTITSSQQRVVPQNKPPYEQNRRTYAPTYERPRMSTRPNFNNSRTTDNNRVGNMPNSRMGNMENTRSVQNTRSNSYSTPQRREYVSPSTNNTNSQINRSFNSSGESRRDFGGSGGNFGGSSGGSNVSRSSGNTGGDSGRRR